MSTPWRITRGDLQFTVKDVAELKIMAVGGKIHPGDLVQPPGSGEWLYATEVQELTGLIKDRLHEVAADVDKRARRNRSLRRVAFVFALLVFGGTGVAAWQMRQTIEKRNQAPLPLIGDAEGQLGPLEGLTTEYATLLSQPDGRSSQVGEVKKDQVVQLIRKMGDFFEVQTADGKTGWLGTTQVVQGYLFSRDLHAQYDPLFNPHKYLELGNYAWTPRMEPGKPETLTDMMFTLVNPTDYGMADVVLKLTFFDGSNQQIDTRDFAVPRLVSPRGDLFLEGIEIDMSWDENTRAEAKIVAARALLPAEYTRLKKEEDARLAAEAESAGKNG
jgi:hypothetical protein